MQSTDTTNLGQQARTAESHNELAALKKRLIGAGVGNFLCSGWHLYLGISILSTWRSSQAGFGYVFVCFAVLQVIAGVWMLARPNARLFIADAGVYFFCAVMNMMAGELGAVAWLKYVGMFQVLLGFDACRRYRLFKHAGKQREEWPVIIDSPPAAAQNAPSVAAATTFAPDSAVAGLSLAGSWQQGAFVLTRDEMKAVLANPGAFDNVLVGMEMRVGGAPETWILVLGRGAGIALCATGEHVRSFTPDDVSCSRGIVTLRTSDGTKVIPEDTVALWAWRSGSEETFLEGADRSFRPSLWDLLCWSLTRDRRPEAWLSWRPSYGSREQGLRSLCDDGTALDQMVKKCGVTVAAKWIARAEPPEAEILRSCIRAVALRQSKLGQVLSAPLVVVGLLLAIPTILQLGRQPIDSPFVTVGAVVGCMLTISGVVAFLIALHRNRVAARLAREGSKRVVLLVLVFLGVLPGVGCRFGQVPDDPPSGRKPAAAARRTVSDTQKEPIVEQGAPSEETPRSLITGTMPVVWKDGEVMGKNDKKVVQLVLSDRSDWNALECSGKESLTVLFCYVRNASPGIAARYLEAGAFKPASGGWVMQSVLKPEGKGLDFCFMGGHFGPRTEGGVPDGAVVSIFGYDPMKTAVLRSSQTIQLRFSAKLFDSTVKLQGDGRVAFVIQKGEDLHQKTVSNVIELPVSFIEAPGE